MCVGVPTCHFTLGLISNLWATLPEACEVCECAGGQVDLFLSTLECPFLSESDKKVQRPKWLSQKLTAPLEHSFEIDRL